MTAPVKSISQAGSAVMAVLAASARRVTPRRGAHDGPRVSPARGAGRAGRWGTSERPGPPGRVRLSVVVPAYREPRIGDTVRRLHQALQVVALDGGLEIVVVDDGSGDDTAQRALDAGADRVIRQPANRGKGAAVQAGMLAASGRTIAFTDADLSYSPDQLLGLLDEVEAGWDAVVGSRHHGATRTVAESGILRRLGHQVIHRCTTVVLADDHADTQCGLKAFRADVARAIFSRSRVDGFAFDVEVFHLIERFGFSVLEVPVRVENSSTSTVRVGRDAIGLLYDLVRIHRWSRIGSYDLTSARADPPISAA
jgi:dolichyl-phosphate beta-glucosyltransferase